LVEGTEVHGLRYPEAMVGYCYADTPPLTAWIHFNMRSHLFTDFESTGNFS
jgi:hypothetical protein